MPRASTTTPTLSHELLLDLRGPRLLPSLKTAIREAITTGRLAPGQAMPSSRSLAVDIGVSRSTVVTAYSDLVDEGWLTARHGSRTRVATLDVLPPRHDTGVFSRHDPLYDLRAGQPDLSAFPRDHWATTMRRVLSRAPHSALGYGDAFGDPALRVSLAHHLARARGVRSHPDRIIICAGAAQALTVLAAAFLLRGQHTLFIEEYGLDLHRDILRRAGMSLPPLPVDEDGAVVDALPQSLDAPAVMLTPAHQFPTGGALHQSRRNQVITWARRHRGFVIEDDYDGEFRFEGRRSGALQALDPDRVIYMGTSSKTLAPGLRLAWLVVPEQLIEDFRAAVGYFNPCGVIDQLTLAEFMDTGFYDKHVRLMRGRYRARRENIAEVLTAATDVRVSGISMGLHVMLELSPEGERAAIAKGNEIGLALDGLERFRHPETPPSRGGLVIGYANPPASAWTSALHRLCAALT